jgi:hypothetical protein
MLARYSGTRSCRASIVPTADVAVVCAASPGLGLVLPVSAPPVCRSASELAVCLRAFHVVNTHTSRVHRYTRVPELSARA